MTYQHYRKCAAAVPHYFNQSLETDKGLAVQITRIVNEQGDRSLALSDKVTQIRARGARFDPLVSRPPAISAERCATL
jgi:hypothetical protein